VRFEIDYAKLQIKERIGGGSYGTVYKGIWETGHVWCAIKQMTEPASGSSSGSDQEQEQEEEEEEAGSGLVPAPAPPPPPDDYEVESSLLKELHHPNLVACYGRCPGDRPAQLTTQPPRSTDKNAPAGDRARRLPRCIVTELCLTSLHQVLHGRSGQSSAGSSTSGVAIAPTRLLRMCMGVVAGLA
jgi:serine/threonine protein kinase